MKLSRNGGPGIAAAICGVAVLVGSIGYTLKAHAPPTTTTQAVQEDLQTAVFKTASVVTSCNQIVVVIITSETGETYIVDRDSGIPADALKAAIQASQAKVQVYEVGCAVPEPEIVT